MNQCAMDRTLAYLRSPEGQERIKEFWAQQNAKEAIKEKRFEKIDIYLASHSFDELMQRLEKENGDEWGDKCWKKGYEKYPNNKMALLIDYVRARREHINIPWIESSFLSESILFGGYVFATFCGQGCFHRIYKYDTQEALFDC